MLNCIVFLLNVELIIPQQDPIIRVSAAQMTEGWIVRALWSTSSDAAPVASYLAVQFHGEINYQAYASDTRITVEVIT